MQAAMNRRIDTQRNQRDCATRGWRSVSPLATLERGYAGTIGRRKAGDRHKRGHAR